MHFTTANALALFGLLASTASAVNVGYGQELQNGDQTNHWVVWIDGESACPAVQVLGSLTGSPCGQQFQLGGTPMNLCNCNPSSGEPENVCSGGSNSIIETCSSHSAKITCHGDQHDIVQHGRCS